MKDAIGQPVPGKERAGAVGRLPITPSGLWELMHQEPAA